MGGGISHFPSRNNTISNQPNVWNRVNADWFNCITSKLAIKMTSGLTSLGETNTILVSGLNPRCRIWDSTQYYRNINIHNYTNLLKNRIKQKLNKTIAYWVIYAQNEVDPLSLQLESVNKFSFGINLKWKRSMVEAANRLYCIVQLYSKIRPEM